MVYNPVADMYLRTQGHSRCMYLYTSPDGQIWTPYLGFAPDECFRNGFGMLSVANGITFIGGRALLRYSVDGLNFVDIPTGTEHSRIFFFFFTDRHTFINPHFFIVDRHTSLVCIPLYCPTDITLRTYTPHLTTCMHVHITHTFTMHTRPSEVRGYIHNT